MWTFCQIKASDCNAFVLTKWLQRKINANLLNYNKVVCVRLYPWPWKTSHRASSIISTVCSQLVGRHQSIQDHFHLSSHQSIKKKLSASLGKKKKKNILFCHSSYQPFYWQPFILLWEQNVNVILLKLLQ